MELKEFIKETLLNITEGVNEANEDSSRFSISDQKQHRPNNEIFGGYVEFDISLIAIETIEGKTKDGIGVALASIGGEVNGKQDNQYSHRLKFRIFINEKEVE